MKMYTVPAEQAPFSLLLLADPSQKRLKNSLRNGFCYVAEDNGNVLGSCIVSDCGSGVYELHSIAVEPDEQAKGIGTRLLKYVANDVRRRGGKRLEVGTGTFGHQLVFYQRAGFRVESVDRDFFLKNYDQPLWEFGIQHKDMLRLALEL